MKNAILLAKVCSVCCLFFCFSTPARAIIHLKEACIGQPYNEAVSFTLGETYTVLGYTVHVQRAQLTGVSGLPEGLSYSCNPCTVQPGQTALAYVTGTPTANNAPGNYPIRMTVTVTVNGAHYNITLPNTNYPDVAYVLPLADCSGCGAVTLTSSTTPAGCVDDCDGTATIQASGGTPPYSYKWDSGTGSQLTQTAVGLCAGLYQVTVTDANGCVKSTTVTVGAPTELTVNVFAITDISCGNSTGGAITVVARGGTPPYSYEWEDGTTGPFIGGLSPGDYSVLVQDSKGCQTTLVVPVTQTFSLDVIVTDKQNTDCGGAATGSITVDAPDGILPITYHWSTGATTATIANLGAGSYTVTVTDASGCSGIKTVTIAQNTGAAQDMYCDLLSFSYVGQYNAPRYQFSVPDSTAAGRWTVQGGIYSNFAVGIGRTKTVQFTFPSQTVYTVCYIYVENGCEISCCKNISIEDGVDSCGLVVYNYRDSIRIDTISADSIVRDTMHLYGVSYPGFWDLSYTDGKDTLRGDSIVYIPAADTCEVRNFTVAYRDTSCNCYKLCTGDLLLCPDEGCDTTINLVINGGFDSVGVSFISDLEEHCTCQPQTYCIASSPTQKCPLAPVDSSKAETNDYFLIVDGATNLPATIWQQTVSVEKGITYDFSIDFYPNLKPVSNPTVQLMVNGVAIGEPITGTPDVWSTITQSWQADSSQAVAISVVQIGEEAGAFGMDNLKFEYCQPSDSTEQTEPAVAPFSLVSTSTTNTAMPLRLYPNPSSDNITVGFNLLADSSVLLEITDMNGKRVLHQQYSFTKGNQEIQLTHHLPSGMYVCRLFSESKAIGYSMLVVAAE